MRENISGRAAGLARARWHGLVLLCAALLCGCGGGGGSAGDSEAAAAPATVASAVSASTPPQTVPTNAAPAQPVLALVSQAGTGPGRSLSYDHGTARITLQASGARLHLEVEGDETWRADLVLPAPATAWTPGVYTGLVRYPFQPAGGGAMSWTGEGHGCNTLTGTLEVRSVRYDNDQLTAIDLSFEQRCDGATAVLRGSLTWDALAPVPVAGPLNPPPATLWKPPTEVTAKPGNAMYIISDAGDFIGQGWTYWIGAATAAAGGGGGGESSSGTVTVTQQALGGRLSLQVTGAVSWHGEFQTPSTMTRLQPGYYGVLKRASFHNPVRGGMSWSMDSRGCNQLLGWYAIDQLVYAGDQLQSVELRFEQFCEGILAPLRGWVRWNSAATTG